MGLQAFAKHQLQSFRALLGDDVGYSIAGDSHLYELALEDFLGGLPTYVRVNERNAMKIGTVANGVNNVAATVGRIPLVAERGGQRVPQANQPSLLGQFERGVPMATTMYWTARSLTMYPHAWWAVLERDYYGWPVRGEMVKQSRLSFDGDGQPTKIDADVIRPDARLGRRPQDIIRFDSPLGEGFLANADKIVRRALAIDLAAAKVEDSPIPVIELHDTANNELDKDQREELLDSWIEARRRRGPAYTPKRLELKVHGKPVDQLLIDGRRRVDIEIIRELSIPAWAANAAVEGSTMVYDNRQLRNWELVDLGLAGYFTAIGGRLSLDDVTPHGWKVKSDADELTRPDLKTRFETYAIGKREGFIDNTWIAEQEGWASVPADKPEEAAA